MPSWPRAHPRSRGENITWIAQLITSCGSSPLTRGKPLASLSGCEIERLIPAHAGKTGRRWLVCAACAAHPRSRGENRRERMENCHRPGSSPLTRGKQGVGLVGNGLDGLIPAHAGKTVQVATPAQIDAAHPRSRGENSQRLGPQNIIAGSSPLTRGKQCMLSSSGTILGLIPAHAGKTDFDARSFAWNGAHPRSRGENHHAAESS